MAEASGDGGGGNDGAVGDATRKNGHPKEDAVVTDGVVAIASPDGASASSGAGADANGHATDGAVPSATSNGTVVVSTAKLPGPSVRASCSGGGAGGDAQGRPKITEAARWLARVRAKIAQMDAARALAAEQSYTREAGAAKALQHSSEAAQRRARHGPGHVPSRVYSEKPGTEGNAQDAATGAGGKVAAETGGGGGRVDVEQGETAWKVPRPPPLNVEPSPAMVMNTYSLRAKFQVSTSSPPPPRLYGLANRQGVCGTRHRVGL